MKLNSSFQIAGQVQLIYSLSTRVYLFYSNNYNCYSALTASSTGLGLPPIIN